MDRTAIRDMIQRHEGYSSEVYICPAGARTIGFGHNLDAHPLPIYLERGITRETALDILESDIDRAIADARSLVPTFDLLPSAAQMVLVDMSFNLGRSRLSKFKKMLLAVSAGNFDRAASEMIESDWYSQVGDRSRELVGMMRSAG